MGMHLGMYYNSNAAGTVGCTRTPCPTVDCDQRSYSKGAIISRQRHPIKTISFCLLSCSSVCKFLDLVCHTEWIWNRDRFCPGERPGALLRVYIIDTSLQGSWQIKPRRCFGDQDESKTKSNIERHWNFRMHLGASHHPVRTKSI